MAGSGHELLSRLWVLHRSLGGICCFLNISLCLALSQGDNIFCILIGYINPFCYFLSFFLFWILSEDTWADFSHAWQKDRGLDVRKPFKFVSKVSREGNFELGWQLLSCWGNPHGNLSDWGTTLHWAAEEQWAVGSRCLPCSWLLS